MTRTNVVERNQNVADLDHQGKDEIEMMTDTEENGRVLHHNQEKTDQDVIGMNLVLINQLIHQRKAKIPT